MVKTHVNIDMEKVSVLLYIFINMISATDTFSLFGNK